jgi:NAD(P)H dehydrogenase (quinone)
MHDGSADPPPGAPRVLVVLCHPNPKSYTHAVCHAVCRGLSACQVERVDLYAEKFEPALWFDDAHRRRDLDKVEETRRYRELLAWCDAMVFVYPVWWGSFPAMLKGFIDRVFVSGLTYTYEGRKDAALAKGLMKAKGAHFFYTLDAPALVARFDPSWLAIVAAIFWYCGFGTITRSYLPLLKRTTPAQRAEWLVTVERRARTIAHKLRKRRALPAGGPPP